MLAIATSTSEEWVADDDDHAVATHAVYISAGICEEVDPLNIALYALSYRSV